MTRFELATSASRTRCVGLANLETESAIGQLLVVSHYCCIDAYASMLNFVRQKAIPR